TRALVVRSRGGRAEWNNFAAFGLSVVDAEGNSVSEVFPRLLFSAYNVPEHTPVIDTSGEALISTPDMFRGDMMHRVTLSEKVLDFFCWLASNRYTAEWDMHQLITAQSTLVASRNAAKMAILPGGSELSQSLLHCEQVLLYMILKDDSLIRDLVSRLITQNGAFASLISRNSIITFDILTYNDMCPKCFSTCYHLQKTLETNINRILFEEIRKLGKLTDFSKRGAFPISVQIQISSFRPFLIMDDLMTRGIKGSQTYVEYSVLKSPVDCAYSRSLPVVQIINPSIAQHILSYEFDDFIRSVQHLGEYESAGNTRKLVENFQALITSNSIEPAVVNDMMTKFVTNEKVFTRPDVCYATLPLIIELSKHITDNQEQTFNFIRDLAARSRIQTIDEINPLIERLKTIPENPASIAAAINDQQMLANMIGLIMASVANQGHYDFNTMASAAEQINLTNVHPIIFAFINLKVEEICRKIKHINLPNKLKNAFFNIGVKL
ncbi:MAG: hypothetical protein LBQ08_00355, partial [Holosporaceae bacterium]|nr:hypothetical protein [Holosporaceae bacterium]